MLRDYEKVEIDIEEARQIAEWQKEVSIKFGVPFPTALADLVNKADADREQHNAAMERLRQSIGEQEWERLGRSVADDLNARHKILCRFMQKEGK